MTNNQDIRWQQRFSNFKTALSKLEQAVTRIKEKYYSDNVFDESLLLEEDDILKEGVIQRFEYTHELAWNVMKDFLTERGTTSLYGSKDTTREAFTTGLITDGEVWMSMIASRNKTSHPYSQKTADEIFLDILERFFPAFLRFQIAMEEKRYDTQTKLF